MPIKQLIISDDKNKNHANKTILINSSNKKILIIIRCYEISNI